LKTKIFQIFDNLNLPRVALLLIVLGFLVYGNVISHPFVHDDVVFIKNNPDISTIDYKQIFLKATTPSDLNDLANTYYRPVIELAYRVQYKMYGLNPHGYHLFNILLHVLNSFLVFLLIDAVAKDRRGLSFTIAVFFLIHPVQTEAVACISGLSNLLFAFFVLGSFILYILANKKEMLSLYIFSLISFFVALMTKEQAVVLPLLIIAYSMIYSEDNNESVKKSCCKISGFFIVVCLYFIARGAIVGEGLGTKLVLDGEFSLRMMSVPRLLNTFLRIIVWPTNLHYYRSIDILKPFGAQSAILMFVIIVVVAIIKTVHNSRKKLLLFAIAWFGITMLPTMNIIPLVNEYSFVLAMEHFLYLPIVGVLLFTIGAVGFYARKSKSSYEKWFLVAVGCVFIILTVKQNTTWKDEISIFERSIKYGNPSGRVYQLLGKAYLFDGRAQDALGAQKKALSIMRGYNDKVTLKEAKEFYTGFIGEINNEMGYTYRSLGDLEKSTSSFQKALSIRHEDGSVLNNLGINCLAIGDMNGSIKYFEEALSISPDDLVAMNNLAICYLKEGDPKKAEHMLRSIVAKDETFSSANANLKKLLSSGEQK